MHLVFNERTKHTASWFNTLATALIAAGAFAPIAALLYGLSTPESGIGYLLALVIGCVVVGLSIHLCGWAMLGRLRE
jgi:hypothetical protein